jgi:hypothetical protein
MNLRIFAIGMPDSYSELLFFTLAGLGLGRAPIVTHELFTSAGDFTINKALDNELGENNPTYQLLANVAADHFLPGFTFYTKAGAKLLSRLGFKKIIIVRDPRDLAVAHMQVVSQSADPLGFYYQSMPDDMTRLRASISGFTEKQSGRPGVMLQSLHLRFGFFLPWVDDSDTLVIRFEDLAGPLNGGNTLTQLKTLQTLCNWLGLDKSDKELQVLANTLSNHFYQHAPTTQVGIWKNYFTPELIPIFKNVAGSVLKKFSYETDVSWLPPEINSRVIAITQPKAGTYLLEKALHELGLNYYLDVNTDLINLISSGDPKGYQILEALQPGEYALGHLFYSWNSAQMLNSLNYKKFLIIRDPHDVVVSYFRWVCATPSHPLSQYFLNLPDDDTRLMEAIRGVAPLNLLNINESLNYFVEWMKEPNTLLIRFEDLIGTAGQGNHDRQIQTLQAICQHLGFDKTLNELETVADRVFDRSSATFKEGQIGTWKRYFKPAHHALMNKLLDERAEQLGYTSSTATSLTSATSPALALTLPGAGLFLLDLALDELGLGRQFFLKPFPIAGPFDPMGTVPINLLNMQPNSYKEVYDHFARVTSGKYALTYMPYSRNGLKLVDQIGFKKIILVRDPRDVAIALCRYLSTGLESPLIPYYQSLPSDDDRLMTTIRGVTELRTSQEPSFLLSIGEMLNHLLNWIKQPDTLVVRYEDLVGKAGGGSLNKQIEVLAKISDYLGLEKTSTSLKFVAENINQRSKDSVLEGYIGEWESNFKSQHIKAFEEVAGNQLSELGYD